MRRTTSPTPFLVFGAVVLLGIAAAPSARPTVIRIARRTMDWTQRVIARVSRHEGTYNSLNLNSDGAGLSFGIVQWAQKPGGLGALLREMWAADPERFGTTFGPNSQALLDATAAGRLDPVGGVVLWQEPWVSRFRAAGNDPVFRAVQDRLAVQGPHFQGALACAQILGVQTERAMALFYDTAVQQGPTFATKLATRVRDELAAQGPVRVDYAALLRRYAQLAPARFRRTTAPTQPYPSSHIEWRATGSEWHAWAGQFDLYSGILRRRMGIVEDADLSDAPITATAEA